MISSIHWNPVIPLVPLVLTAVVVLAVLVILEWRRMQKFKWIRITCQVVAVASVLGLLLRPTMESTTTLHPVLILTDGFEESRLDSLMVMHPGMAVYCMPGAPDFSTAERLTDFRQLNSLHGEPVWVIGAGFPNYALADVPFDFQYLPGRQPEGVTELKFEGKGEAERWNSLEGAYFASSSRRRMLRLLGPAGIEDSVAISGEGTTRFSLTFFPKVAGRIIYKLEETDSNGRAVNSYSLPVSVVEERKLDILLVNDYPSFEQRYLKNFLAAKGHRVAIRNRVSKDRFHQEFANREPLPLRSLGPAVLDETDILIIDQGSFQSAPDSEKKAITNAMKKGLGVLLLAFEKSKGEQLISFEALKDSPDTVRFSVEDAGTFTLPAATVKPSVDVTSWLVSKEGRVLTGCLCTGASRTGFQLLRETFQLGLEGKTAAYASIWSPLLERVARRASMEFDITTRTPFPWYSNEPIEFDVVSGGATPSLRFDDMELPLREDVNVEGLWHGQLWADGNKWHVATINDIDSVAFGLYDLPGNEWVTMRLARQIRANSQHTSAHVRTDDVKVNDEGPIPTLLLLLFLLSSGFLWLAPKI